MPTNIVSGGGGGPNVLDVECCRAQCGDCVSAHVGEDIGDFTGFLLICLDHIFRRNSSKYVEFCLYFRFFYFTAYIFLSIFHDIS